jgi:hypothetical protein
VAHAYTPGLKVAAFTKLRRERKLPLAGTVLVQTGQRVEADTIVARTELPGNVHSVNVANLLGILPEDVPDCLAKPVGSKLEKGEAIAESRSFFGLFKSKCPAPVSGSVESVSKITGQVLLREAPIPVEVDAYIDGTVVEVHPGQGVTVETEGTFIQGIFGVGGETRGVLHMAVDAADKSLVEGQVGPEVKGKVLIGGAHVTTDVLLRAKAMGAAAVVTGGFDDQDLRKLLGYDLGVAITGSEELGITLIVTEGFGRISMAGRTFELLQSCEGKRVSVTGATQIRAGVLRPEIVASRSRADVKMTDFADSSGEEGLKIGSPVRVIRQPYFGRLGTVAALPPDLTALETEAKVRVLEVDFGNGARVLVPRANVEMIES